MPARAGTTLVLVLHGHLPSVVGHGVWPHGAEWLHEAAAETYVPFLRAARTLASAGVAWKATVGMTPVLCEQLSDPRFAAGFRRYLRERARAAEADAGQIPSDGEGSARLARRWSERYQGILADFDGLLGGDVVGAFRDLAEAGFVETIGSGATHGFLPLLPSDEAVARQLEVGLAAHERHFGRRPRGLWLPECAYRPTGAWVSPGTGRRAARRGLEELLVEAGVAHTFVETHLVSGGRPGTSSGGPGGCGASADWPLPPGARSPYRPWGVAGSGGHLTVLARDPRSSEQVWSGLVGYPGDGAYLEFHKKRSTGGLRYWRITDRAGGFDEKETYDPGSAQRRVRAHVAHFCDLLAGLPAASGEPAPVATAMFDFELFGHWWHEGVDFLQELLRALADHPAIRMATAAEAIAGAGPAEVIPLPSGSWGRNGDYSVWWNEETVDYWRRVERAEEALAAIADADSSLLPAALRQVLLLQSSDWPFLVEGGAAADYALRRIRGHAGTLRTLVAIARRRGRRLPADPVFLEGLARRDRLFGPELEGAGTTSGRPCVT